MQSIINIITELSDSSKAILNSRLAYVSGLNTEGLERFREIWLNTETKRRQQLISRMVELAEDNFEFDFDDIFRYCLGDPDAEVRSKAIEGLWESEDSSLVNSVADRLETDSSEKVQTAAAIALGKYAMLAALGKLRPQYAARIKQALLGALEDSERSIEVRRRVLEAVAPLNIPQVKEIIKQAYYGDNQGFKVSAVYAMGKNCDSSWLPLILNELGSTDPEMRYEAAGACGELGEEEAVPYLTELINDPDVEVQLAAIQALGKIGGEEARECLIEYSDNPSRAIREMVEQALSEMEIYEDPFSFHG